jgi:hypothetical protein
MMKMVREVMVLLLGDVACLICKALDYEHIRRGRFVADCVDLLDVRRSVPSLCLFLAVEGKKHKALGRGPIEGDCGLGPDEVAAARAASLAGDAAGLVVTALKPSGLLNSVMSMTTYVGGLA